jgi:hypothetical protein
VAIRAENIFAGISGAGTSGAELIWFGGDGGVVAPTDAMTALVTTQTSEVQTVTIANTPTSGTWTLSYRNVTTSSLAYNITTSALTTALEALSTVGTGGVTITGTPGASYVITFAGALANQNVPMLVADPGTLAGAGATPTVSVVETTPGKTGWLSAGLITEDGATEDSKEASKEVRAFGLQTSVRKIVTSSDITVKLAMLETNKVTAAIRARLPLGSITVSNGAFLVREGHFRTERYAMVIHAVDGLNVQRTYYPSVEVTERDSKQIKNGEVVARGVTLTAYPDSSGWASYEYNLISGLT